GFEKAISLDMGGTSTDVSLIVGGQASLSAEREVDGLPLRLPAVDLQTVGAGGGSVVWEDSGGAARAGPESAGGDPGPACYGRCAGRRERVRSRRWGGSRATSGATASCRLCARSPR